MRVYQTDREGFFVDEALADPDPLMKGNWLIPGGCVLEPPPALSANQRAKWQGGAWVVIDVPQPVEPDPVEPPPITREHEEAVRRAAYANEADPLFFKWQAGEATKEEWLAKRAEVKERHPYIAS